MSSYSHTFDMGGKKRYYACGCGWGASGSVRDVDSKVRLHDKKCNWKKTCTDEEVQTLTAAHIYTGSQRFIGNGNHSKVNLTQSFCNSNGLTVHESFKTGVWLDDLKTECAIELTSNNPLG